MRKFSPRYDILPPAQRRVCPELRELPRHFVLYGGTALALRLGHRVSVDFDFFSSESFSPEKLLSSLRLFSEAKVLQNVSQTLTVSIYRGGEVKLSFFGGLELGRVGEPEQTDDESFAVASLLDLAGMKAAVVTQRAESKDYIDLLALMENGINLADAIGAARAIYGRHYNPAITLKSLAYFGDGDLHRLSPTQKSRLTEIATDHSLDLPEIARLSNKLASF
jgi:hypothetical protein